MVKWKDFVAWLFLALLSYQGWDMTSTMKNLTASVADLNKNVAVVITQVANHDEEIRELKTRVKDVEDHERKSN
jgi:hypothetical protein